MISIDTLPDDVLLVIFDHHLCNVRREAQYHYPRDKRVEKAWKSLVHVCRRWRSIVFESPRRLDLRLVCTGRTPARDRLDVWQTLPLIIEVDFGDSKRNMDNIIAALERTDRVCQIDLLDAPSPDMEIFLAAMQQPFPALTHLRLQSNDETLPIPDSFLGGSAPLLEDLALDHIPFPGLLKLLLSTTHLVTLNLISIPHSGYFPPDTIATVLSTLTVLDSFGLGFISTRSCPDRESRRPPPSTRTVLPFLIHFWFKGVSEYSEDLIALIDAPQLKNLSITFFNDIVFDTPQLTRFISRTSKLKALERADITFLDYAARVDFSSWTSYGGSFMVEVSCKGLDWQLSSLEQVCTSCLPPLSMLENLYFDDPQADWTDIIDDELWVELLRPFSAVKRLFLSDKAASYVGSALQELVEGRTTEALPTILPTVQTIFVKWLEPSGYLQEGIGQFVAARQVSGHHIDVSDWSY